MPKKISEEVRMRTYLLRQAGHTLDEIMGQLDGEFSEDRVPDRSTVSRHLKRFESVPPEELSEDKPFAWSSMSGVPWEDSRLMLDVWAFYTERVEVPLTERDAKWIWRVLNALDLTRDENRDYLFSVEPETSNGDDVQAVQDYFMRSDRERLTDVLEIAREYSLRETASVILNTAFDTRDLDMFLTFTPWRDHDSLHRYIDARYWPMDDPPTRWQWVSWHIHDPKWIESVTPGGAPRLGTLSSWFGDKGTDNPFLEPEFLRAIDGMLPDQLRAYLMFGVGESRDETFFPWWFLYLEETLAPDRLERLGLYPRQQRRTGGTEA